MSTTISSSFWHFPIISVIHMVREISPPSHVLASQEKTQRKGRVSSSRCAALQRVGYFRPPSAVGERFCFCTSPTQLILLDLNLCQSDGCKMTSHCMFAFCSLLVGQAPLTACSSLCYFSVALLAFLWSYSLHTLIQICYLYRL